MTGSRIRARSVAGGAVWMVAVSAGAVVPAQGFVEPPAARLEWQAVTELQGRSSREPVTLAGVPVDRGTIDLVLEPFSPVTAATRFVVGRPWGDEPMSLDLSGVRLYRGRVLGGEGHAFLALTERAVIGRLEVAGGRYWIGGTPARVQVFAAGAADRSPRRPLCGLDDLLATHSSSPADGAVRHPGSGGPAARSTRILELAVETDHEFWQLFGDSTAAAEYVVLLYGGISDVYLRDTNLRVELSFVRLWENPSDEPTFLNEPEPFIAFGNYWNGRMQYAHRDAAQLLSGRRDLPYGGVAWLSGLCDSNGYSVVGDVTGAFPTPDHSVHSHYDTHVAAHELGHTCSAVHTHSLGIDNCNSAFPMPQRGTIMSYCALSVSGGNACTDQRFHARIQLAIEYYAASRACLAADCNGNGVSDDQDLIAGTSTDRNDNSVPDECEDCNDNRILDSADIAQGTSSDIDEDAVPDECQPDCNGNGLPDTWEIAEGLVEDRFGNNVPDPCEPDCNGNGLSDYNELQDQMHLDIDRDVVLDECQDCDDDGTPDAAALDGAHSLWLAGLTMNTLAEFHGGTGVRVRWADEGHVSVGADLLIDPSGRILVSSRNDDRVVEFDRSGAYIRDLVPAAAGVDGPSGLAIGPDGNLYVASRNGDAVLSFDLATGQPLGVFVTAGAGGLDQPQGLAFRSNGHLLVTSAANHSVLEYDAGGRFVGVFVPAGSGGLFQPAGLTYKPDGHLLVASFAGNALLEYDGQTGAFRRRFDKGGTPEFPDLQGPWNIRIGPNGNVFASNLYDVFARVYEFDTASGNYLRSVVLGNDTQFFNATGFDFMPGWDRDCNVNFHPDSCDIASGLGSDANGDGVLDSCQVDCNANGAPDYLDLVPRGTSLDCNANHVPDACDLALGTSSDCNVNGVPDTCDIAAGLSDDCDRNAIPDECLAPEEDCNSNGLPDSCDLAAGSSSDCDHNGVPDACDIAAGDADDCDADGVPDQCHVAVPAPLGVQPLNTNAGEDTGADSAPFVATDGAGGWLAAWHSTDDLGGTIGPDLDILYARSTDGGATWSSPRPLNANAASDAGSDLYVQLAAGAAGRWVAVWESTDDLGGGIGSDWDILYAVSEDGGVTWSEPAAVNTHAAGDTGDDQSPALARGPSGRWIVAWQSNDPMGAAALGRDWDLLFAVSDDAGGSWSDPVPLNTDAATDADDDADVAVAASGGGRWVAVWTSHIDLEPGIGLDPDIVFAYSNDGQTWTAPAALASYAAVDGREDGAAQIATDGQGRWVAVWESADTFGGFLSDDRDIFVAASVDDGVHWGPAMPLNTNAQTDTRDDIHPHVASDGGGLWVVLWASAENLGGILGVDDDILVTSSADGSHPWTAPAPLTAEAAVDGSAPDVLPHLATDRAGRWVAAWRSRNDLDGTIGTDFDLLWTAWSPQDCNANGVLDECDIAAGTSLDEDGDGVPDECQCPDATAPELLHSGAGRSFAQHAFSGYIDPRAESSNGLDLDLGLRTLTVVFSEPVYAWTGAELGVEDFGVFQTGGLPAPSVRSVDARANPAIEIGLDRPITPQEWTTVVARVQDACGNAVPDQGDLGDEDEPDRIDVALLPGDIDQNGIVEPIDYLRVRQFVTGGGGSPEKGSPADYFDTDRSGAIDPLDVLRYRQLLFGTGPTTRVWAGEPLWHDRP